MSLLWIKYMIYRFGGTNFFSFKERFEVDFRVPERASDRNIFHVSPTGGRVNTVVGVFGGNASGKTNLLKVVGFIQWLIVDSAQDKVDSELPEQHFRFSKKISDTYDLFIEFDNDGKFYRYEVSADRKRILSEALFERKERLNYCFKRQWNAREKKYDVQAKSFKTSKRLLQRQNASAIAMAALNDDPFAREIVDCFRRFYGNLCFSGRSERHDPVMENLVETAEFFKKEPALLSWVNKRIKHFDLGLSRIEIQEVVTYIDNKEQKIQFPVGIHTIAGRDYYLPLIQESRGTQALFVLLRVILPVLHVGGVAFIDEFEMGLHSHVIPRLVELFYSAKHNRKNAQLLFSCHSDHVLVHLEKYQVQLVEKGENGASETWRLDSMRGVRNVDNLNAKYHAGAYGGVPNF